MLAICTKVFLVLTIFIGWTNANNAGYVIAFKDKSNVFPLDLGNSKVDWKEQMDVNIKSMNFAMKGSSILHVFYMKLSWEDFMTCEANPAKASEFHGVLMKSLEAQKLPALAEGDAMCLVMIAVADESGRRTFSNEVIKYIDQAVFKVTTEEAKTRMYNREYEQAKGDLNHAVHEVLKSHNNKIGTSEGQKNIDECVTPAGTESPDN